MAMALLCAQQALGNPCLTNENSEACRAFRAGQSGEQKIKATAIPQPAPATSTAPATSFGLASTVDRVAANTTNRGAVEAENQVRGAEERYGNLLRRGSELVSNPNPTNPTSRLSEGDRRIWRQALKNPDEVDITKVENRQLADIIAAMKIEKYNREQFAQDYMDLSRANLATTAMGKENGVRNANLAVIRPDQGPAAAKRAQTGGQKSNAVDGTGESRLTDSSSKILPTAFDPALFPRDEDRSRRAVGGQPQQAANKNVTEKKEESAAKTPGKGNSDKSDLHELAKFLGQLKMEPKDKDKAKDDSKGDDLLMLAVKLTPEQLLTTMMGKPEGQHPAQGAEVPVQASRAPASAEERADPTLFERVSKRIRVKATLLGMAN